MDIATLLETHRKHMLELTAGLYEKGEDGEAGHSLQVMANAHDRATTKTLLDMYRAGTPETITTPAPAPITAATKSRTIKPGSKAAKARAQKAQETRRKNLADKAASRPAANTQRREDGSLPDTEPAMSTAMHLPRRTDAAPTTPGLTPPPGSAA
jgi:hypothetical protein